MKTLAYWKPIRWAVLLLAILSLTPPTTARATDLSVTAASVVPSATGLQTEIGTAGATITRGQVVYKDASDANKFKLVDNDAEGTSSVYGISLSDVATGQTMVVMTAGTLNPGATVTVGTVYTSSSTAGGIAPVSDGAQGDYVSIIGVGLTSSTMQIKINNSGVAKP